MPKDTTTGLAINRPSTADLPAGHPFLNPARLAAIQKLCPSYKPMKTKDYRAKPYVHPANVTDRGVKEIFPPYHFLPSDFVKGKAGMAEVKWPSHAYMREDILCGGSEPAIVQIKCVGERGSLILAKCFECELREGKLLK